MRFGERHSKRAVNIHMMKLDAHRDEHGVYHKKKVR